MLVVALHQLEATLVEGLPCSHQWVLDANRTCTTKVSRAVTDLAWALIVSPSCAQQRGGNGGAGAGAQDDRMPLGQGRNNSDPAHGRGRGGRARSSAAQTRRSLDYGMQRALMTHTVDENVRPLVARAVCAAQAPSFVGLVMLEESPACATRLLIKQAQVALRSVLHRGTRPSATLCRMHLGLLCILSLHSHRMSSMSCCLHGPQPVSASGSKAGCASAGKATRAGVHA